MPHTKDNYIFKPDIERISVQGSKDTIKVPFNKINLSNGDSVLVSTVEGPDVNAKTLPKVNEGYTPYIIDGDKKKVKKTFFFITKILQLYDKKVILQNRLLY